MRLTRHALLVLVVLATGFAAPSGSLAADPPSPATTRDDILVRFRPNTTPAARKAVARDLNLSLVRESRSGRTAVLRGKGVSAATVRRELAADPRISAVGRNYKRELQADPTDPGYAYEWGVNNTGQTIEVDPKPPITGVPDVDIDGLEALRIQHGKASIVVAVIDDGVDFSHPDLAGRKWKNPGETPGDGIDNDGNGYVDDINGWDFCHDDASVHDAGHDGHGTHVAGTIAASLNGTGVIGVAPGVSIMALKFIDDVDKCGMDDQAINAIDYAANNGADVINASWGGADANPVLDQTIADSGLLFVAAAGNGGVDLDAPGPDFFPAESNAENILAVGAIDQTGELADFTNFGATKVDLFAPGTNILSTYPAQSGCPSPCYAWSDGTSMAAPHVTGIAALALSKASGPMSAASLRSLVLAAAVPLQAASCLSVTGRLANAYRAVTSPVPTAIAPCVYRFDVGSVVGTGISSTVSWRPATGTATGSRYVILRRVESAPWSTIATRTGRTIQQTLRFGTSYRYATRTLSTTGKVSQTAYGRYVETALFQEGTSLARYSGSWANTASSTASGGKLRTSTQANAYVEFKGGSLSTAVIGRRGPTSGKAKIYVDGVLASTIDLYHATAQSRVVLFSRAWYTVATHTIRVVVVGTAGRPRVDIDGFAIAR